MVKRVKALSQTNRINDFRELVERQFGVWGHQVYSHPWLIIFIMLAITASLGSQLPKIDVDTSTEGFLYEDDPVRVRYDAFRQQFSNDNKTLMSVETTEVFNTTFLKRFKELHEELEREVPYLDDIESLINVRETRGEDDALVVSDFLEDIPETKAALLEKKKAALSNPFYVGTFLSADSKTAVLTIKNQIYVTDENSDDEVLSGFDDNISYSHDKKASLEKLGSDREREIFIAVKKIIDKYDAPGFRISSVGGPFDAAWFLNMVSNEMSRFTMFAIIAIAVFLLLIFRRAAMLFLPLSVSILAMLSTMSIMAMAGIKISFSMQIVPSFLLAVGVGNSVHLFTVFFQACNRGDNKEEALAYSLQHSGLAIAMTGLTTAGGLLSFLSSTMKPVSEFGMIAPMGVIFALIYSLVLLPALIAVFPIKITKQAERNDTFLRRQLVKCGDIAITYPKSVISIWIFSVCLALVFALQINFSFFPYKNLPEDHYLRQSIEKFDTDMGGSAPLEIVIDTGKKDGIKDPEILQLIDEFRTYATEKEFHNINISKAISIIDVNKELNQALNENNPEFYTIPKDREVVAQELLLFENSGADDLEVLVDSQFSMARMSLTMSLVDGVYYTPVVADLKEKLAEMFRGKAEFWVSGVIDLIFSVFVQIAYSLASSYVIAFLIVTPLMIVLIGNLKIGLISMIPNLAPIIITLGMMSLVGIELTTATLLMGSIALGLVVDDTIHFMHNFQRYYNRDHDLRDAVKQTLETTGQALFFSTVVLSTAFFIFVMNTLSDWAAFGFATGFCITVAFFADIILAPALVALLVKHNEKL